MSRSLVALCIGAASVIASQALTLVWRGPTNGAPVVAYYVYQGPWTNAPGQVTNQAPAAGLWESFRARNLETPAITKESLNFDVPSFKPGDLLKVDATGAISVILQTDPNKPEPVLVTTNAYAVLPTPELPTKFTVCAFNGQEEGDPGYLYFDPATPRPARPPGLDQIVVAIANQGFEDGNASWSISGIVGTYKDTETTVTEGHRAMVFNSGQAKPNGRVSQQFKITQGVKFRMSFDLGILALKKFPQVMLVSIIGSSLRSQQLFTLSPPEGNQPIYSRKTMSFESDSDRIRILFEDLSSQTDSVDMLLDNITFEPVM